MVKPRPGNRAGKRKRTGGGIGESMGEQGADDRVAGHGADDGSDSGPGDVAGEGTCEGAGESSHEGTGKDGRVARVQARGQNPFYATDGRHP